MSRELVACIHHSTLARIGNFHGFTRQIKYNELFNFQPIMIDRETADRDSQHIQVIPYATIWRLYDGKCQFLSYTRMKQGGETRLHGKRSIGFGGHMNHSEPFAVALAREIREEVPGAADYVSLFSGWLRDEHSEVGKVHIGAHYFYEVDEQFEMKFPDPSIGRPSWETYEELSGRAGHFEAWSQLLILNVLPA